MSAKLHIATSGWSYKHWKESYYPPGLKSTDWLSYYAKEFDATEINTSFYHFPRHSTVEGWIQKVSPEFRFCVKLHRSITHYKKLSDCEEPLEKFFEIFAPMQPLMGPVLVQLPPSLKFDYDVAEAFFKLLRSQYSQYDFVLEVRHETWLSTDAVLLLGEWKMGLVISQSGVGFPYTEISTSSTLYIRFHGPEALYASGYSDEMLEDYAGKMQHYLSEGADVWAFFNNDIHGHALHDARRLRGLL